jgi:predicted DNA-binding transcriptional regulator AlpA
MDDVKREARKMMTMDEVLQLIPVGKSTLKRMIKNGEFPPGNYITPNKRVWYEDTVLLWQRSLPAESRRRKAERRAAKSG